MAKIELCFILLLATVIVAEEIPVESCSPKCPANQVYENCAKPLECRPTCTRPNGTEVCHSKACEKGCVCEKGYLLNSNGNCVKPNDCLSRPGCQGCPANKMWSECPMRFECRATCTQQNGTACTRDCAAPACICKGDYVLNSKNDCVPKSQCPKVCPANQVYSKCPSLESCRATCDRQNGTQVCAKICAPAGCICKEGYVLNGKGDCVPKSECPKTCPANQVYSDCPKRSKCRATCAQQDGTPCTKDCDVPSCICKEGYVLNSKGECVAKSECEKRQVKIECPKVCPANQVYSECPMRSKCRATCSQQNGTACTKDCDVPSCICKEGYVLNDKGECVLKSQCPKECPVNQVYSDCPMRSKCRATCSQQNGTACTKDCDVPSCICKEGYVLNSKGDCVAKSECPKLCPANKVWSNCPKSASCRATCAKPNGTEICTLNCDKPACICKEGYVLNDKGDCVSKSECPKTCPVNQVYSECPMRSKCRATCAQQDGTPCTRDCDKPACICKEGYVLNSKGDCVSKSECPKICSANKVYAECPQPAHCRATCAKPNGTEICTLNCDTPTCICKEGYVLNDKGDCVSKSECPKICPANKVYAECPQPAWCRATCAQPNGTEICTLNCDVPTCVCKEGYVLNDKGDCVSKSQCPKVCPVNQVFAECPSLESCRATCDRPSGTQACADVCAPASCVCKKGFVLDSEGNCIEATECPNKKCAANEVFSGCPKLSGCRPSCAQPTGAEVCAAVCAPAGCVCKKGYVLDSEGKCVPPTECPNKKCSANEVWLSCTQPSECRPTCDKPNGAEVCLAVCDPAGCVCKKGYVLDKSGKCVHPSSCKSCE